MTTYASNASCHRQVIGSLRLFLAGESENTENTETKSQPCNSATQGKTHVVHPLNVSPGLSYVYTYVTIIPRKGTGEKQPGLPAESMQRDRRSGDPKWKVPGTLEVSRSEGRRHEKLVGEIREGREGGLWGPPAL